MDACMMGNIEVAYELQNTCDYYIASPMEVPSSGFPYNVIIPYLYSDKIDDYTLNVCDAYSNYYTQEQNWGCCAAVDCKELPVFVNEINKYLGAYPGMELSSVQKYYKEYYDDRFKHLSYDIFDFLNEFTGGDLPSTFITQMNRTIIAKSFVISNSTEFPSFKNVDTSKLCGMGMYVPQENRKVWNEYLMTLTWTKDSGWKSYIDKLYN
jgi:Clostripain family.